MIQTPRFWQGQSIALLCAIAGLLVRFALTPLLHGGFPFICFVPGILIAGLVAGAAAGGGALVYSIAIVLVVYLGPPVGFKLPMFEWTRLAVFSTIGVLLILVATLVRALVRTLVEAEQQALTIAREASHRTRNVLAIVQAIARQTARGTASPEDFTTIFDARLAGLARAQDLQAGPIEDDMLGFVTRATEPFDPARFQLSGARLPVPQDHAPVLALMIYELATNAVKHGALCQSEGNVLVAWRTTGERLKILWEERGGPPVVPPTRRGFGSRLLTSSLSPERGEVTLAFEPQGLVCEIALQLPHGAPQQVGETGGDGLAGLRGMGAALRRRMFATGADVSAEPRD